MSSNKRQTPQQGTTKKNTSKTLDFSNVIMKNSEDDPDIQKIMIDRRLLSVVAQRAHVRWERAITLRNRDFEGKKKKKIDAFYYVL